MDHNYETLTVAKLLSKALPYFEKSKQLRIQISEWLFDESDGIATSLCERSGLNIPEIEYKSSSRFRRGTQIKKLDSIWEQAKEIIEMNARDYDPEQDVVFKNVLQLGKQIGLSDIDCRLLHVVSLATIDDEISNLYETLITKVKMKPTSFMSLVTGCPQQIISNRLKSFSPLIESQIFERNRWETALFQMQIPDVNNTIRDIILSADCTEASIRENLLGLPCIAKLTLKDYVHLNDSVSLARKMLKGAIRQRLSGFNILLYGPPGTGKTELAKTLANEARCEIYSIGEKDYDGDLLCGDQRVALYQTASRLLGDSKNTIMLFDEMEDVLTESVVNPFQPQKQVSSKVYINRMLEHNPVPTIWTCNELNMFDPAIIRRMSLSIEVKAPSKSVRERIWRSQLEKSSVKITDQELIELAANNDVPPALSENAIQAAELVKGGISEIRTALTQNIKAVTGRRLKVTTEGSCVQYNPKLVNPDVDLGKLTKKLKKLGNERPYSFCLYGPPGTGKSAYIRYLADKLDMPVIEKRTSDLLSMWLGGTEANIAKAFEEAKEEQAFLIFDEADSLLQSRGEAHRSWEITQVNEMLTWMESHPYPFACTTNLMENLDEASLRRFTFKVHCDFLNAEQTRFAYKHFFGLDTPTALSEVKNLTPGDFATVHRKASILDELENHQTLLSMLMQEVAVKKGQPRSIGFTVGG